MDNKKIGKLIAKLRNEKGLTQQDLGDKIGVGFRAVSKWERGLTLPDISNINELSKILGISSDELLAGELKEEEELKEDKVNEEDKKKIPLKIKIIVSIATLMILIISSILIYNNEKTYVYGMTSANENEYYVEGQVTFKGNQISIILNRLEFKDNELNSAIINDYEYQIISNDTFIFGYGQTQDGIITDNRRSIDDFTNTFKINYNGNTYLKRTQIVKNNIYVKLKMWDISSNEINKEIEIVLYK